MPDSSDYLGIGSMLPGMVYTIWARNAYAGVWLPKEQGFLISRYKAHPTPFLSIEYHWDLGEPLGTAKPLRPLEACPLPLPQDWTFDQDSQNDVLCSWLDALEEDHPPVPGWDSVGDRRRATVAFLERLSRTRRL